MNELAKNLFCEIFADTDTEQLSADINTRLAKDEGLRVVNVTQSSASDGDESWTFIAVWYADDWNSDDQ